jgi:hypothetical protein
LPPVQRLLSTMFQYRCSLPSLTRRLQRKYILASDCTQKLALEKILGRHYSHFEIVTP